MKFKLYQIVLFGIAVILSTTLTSCTLDDPNTSSDNSVSAEQLQLIGMAAYGLNMMDVSYDNNGRVSEIRFGADNTYTFEYQGSLNVPSTIRAEFYDFYTVNGMEVKKLEEQDIYANIECNSNGLVTKWDYEETSYCYDINYDYDTEKETITEGINSKDTGTRTFEYDSDGHMVKQYSYDDISGYDVDDIYNWENDLLISYGETEDEDHRQWYEIEYSDVNNVHRQWDPNNEIFGPIAITGLFGKAPAKFIKSVTGYSGSYLDDTINYAYTLKENGLIDKCKVSNYDDTMIYTLIYQKKK